MLQPIPQTTTRGALVALTAASVAVLGGGDVGCGDADSVEAWPLRDALSVAPAWIVALPTPARNTLRTRLRHAIHAQRDAGAWAETPAQPDMRRDVRRATAALDTARADVARDPLLVQWASFEDNGDAVAWACPLEPGDLDTTLTDTDDDAATQTPTWRLDTRFNAPLNDARPDGPNEAALLHAQLPRLARWLARCDAAAGDDLSPQGLSGAPIDVIRAPGAPALIAWWPQRRTLAVNPIFATLWPTPAEPQAMPLRRAPDTLNTRAQPIHEDAFARCVKHITTTCAICADQPEARLCEPSLIARVNMPARTACPAISGDDFDFHAEMICAGHIAHAPEISACLQRTPPWCRPRPQPDDPREHIYAFGEFQKNWQCRDVLEDCIRTESVVAPEPSEDPQTCCAWSDALSDENGDCIYDEEIESTCDLTRAICGGLMGGDPPELERE